MTPRKILVCQNNACRRAGAAQVLEAFQKGSPSDVSVESSSCLGQCGNGPMVLVLPDEIWYYHVRSAEVPAIIDRHLIHGKPVKAMMYRKFHPQC